MPKKSATPTLPPVERDPVESGEAAMRLNVVIRMLMDHIAHPPVRGANGHPDDTGGYEITIMRDLLVDIRDGLLADAKGGA